MLDSKPLMEAVIAGDGETLGTLVQRALDGGVSAKEILDRGLIAAMDIVGERMEAGEMFIPEVLMAARTMNEAVETLKPRLAEGDMRAAGKIVIGTVKGDLHDIGKNLVAMMFEGVGFKVYNLGVDVSPQRFVEAVEEYDADLLCLSALLTTTTPMMKETIDAVVKSGLRDRVKIMVGGAPVTRSFAEEIGADGYAVDAGSAAKLAKMLV